MAVCYHTCLGEGGGSGYTAYSGDIHMFISAHGSWGNITGERAYTVLILTSRVNKEVLITSWPPGKMSN